MSSKSANWYSQSAIAIWIEGKYDNAHGKMFEEIFNINEQMFADYAATKIRLRNEINQFMQELPRTRFMVYDVSIERNGRQYSWMLFGSFENAPVSV